MVRSREKSNGRNDVIEELLKTSTFQQVFNKVFNIGRRQRRLFWAST
nr:MAG TPA: hypothetical protein [Caudoviricetes sp.]